MLLIPAFFAMGGGVFLGEGRPRAAYSFSGGTKVKGKR